MGSLKEYWDSLNDTQRSVYNLQSSVNHHVMKCRDYEDGPDGSDDLDAACIAYLSRRGYLCLKKHVEPPTEEGEYLTYEQYPDDDCADVTIYYMDSATQIFRWAEGVSEARVVAYGPLPKGGVS